MRTGALGLLATAGLLLAASLFFSHGSSDGPVAWIGAGAIVAALAAAATALWGRAPLPELGRAGLVCAGLAAAFFAWNGVTILWSVAPDRSWEYFNRGLVYLAFGVVGAFAGSVVGPRLVAWLVGGLIAATCLWSLAGKAIPALYDDYGRLARLRSPVGYWNALALVFVFGLPLALWAATRAGGSRRARAGAVVVLFALLVGLVLTYSRGGVLAALVALAVWFALCRERFKSLVALLGAGVPAAAVLAVALSLPGVADDGQPRAVRVEDGGWFALVFVLGAGLAYAVSYYLRLRTGPELERRILQAAAAAAVVVLAVGAGVALSRGNPLGGPSDVVTQNPERLLSGSSNYRWEWWKEAWRAFEDRPLVGTGAGSFELLHRRYRKSRVDVTEVHNLPLQFASETGLVGLLLAAGAAGAALLGAWRALRRLEGVDRAAALALAAVLPTFLVHSALDYDWEFVTLCGALFFATGVLLAAGRAPPAARRRPLWALACVLVALGALYSVLAPRIAADRVGHAYSALERAQIEAAVSSARSAHSLDPLSVEPLLAWAAAEEARSRFERARELYVEAVDLQPLNWDTWYQLGLFYGEVLGDEDAARHALLRASELDPRNCSVRAALGQECPR